MEFQHKKLKQHQERNVDSLMRMVEGMDANRFEKQFIDPEQSDSLEMLLVMDKGEKPTDPPRPEQPKIRLDIKKVAREHTREVAIPPVPPQKTTSTQTPDVELEAVGSAPTAEPVKECSSDSRECAPFSPDSLPEGDVFRFGEESAEMKSYVPSSSDPVQAKQEREANSPRNFPPRPAQAAPKPVAPSVAAAEEKRKAEEEIKLMVRAWIDAQDLRKKKIPLGPQHRKALQFFDKMEEVHQEAVAAIRAGKTLTPYQKAVMVLKDLFKHSV